MKIVVKDGVTKVLELESGQEFQIKFRNPDLSHEELEITYNSVDYKCKISDIKEKRNIYLSQNGNEEVINFNNNEIEEFKIFITGKS